jgi:hypothetical protein
MFFDLADAFGSVSHDLIKISLERFKFPPHIVVNGVSRSLEGWKLLLLFFVVPAPYDFFSFSFVPASPLVYLFYLCACPTMGFFFYFCASPTMSFSLPLLCLSHH